MSLLASVYPVLAVRDPAAAGRVFTEHFGFEETFAADWYVSLRHDHHELAFVRHDHPTIPVGFGHPVRGVLINLEVEDATAEYARLDRDALGVRLALRDEDFGQRHFIVEGPEGVLIDVIQSIEPSPDFAAAYAGGVERSENS